MYQAGRGSDPVIVAGSVKSFVALIIGKNYIVFSEILRLQDYRCSESEWDGTDGALGPSGLSVRQSCILPLCASGSFLGLLGLAISWPRRRARTAAVAVERSRVLAAGHRFSEPDGYFRSDTLTSNELLFERVIPELLERTRPGGVYLGVGPEQNFTYIAALRPPLAIIFDIRRGNMLVQLMYKALFELAKDRADFVSMLFSRPRPPGLGRRVDGRGAVLGVRRRPRATRRCIRATSPRSRRD